MIKPSKDFHRGQTDLFLSWGSATCIGGAFFFLGRRYRVPGMPKRSPQQQIEVAFDRLDARQVSVWSASGQYLGTAIS